MGAAPKLPPPPPSVPDFASSFLGNQRRVDQSAALGGTFLTSALQPRIQTGMKQSLLGGAGQLGHT